MKHLELRNTIYHYRRRTPAALKSMIKSNMISKALTNNLEQSLQLAKVLDEKLDSLKTLAKLSIGIDISTSLFTSTNHQPTIVKHSEPNYNFSDTAENYLSTISITPSKLNEYETMKKTLTHIIANNEITFDKLDVIKKTITNLPKRNIQKYRKMTLKELLSAKVKDEHKISTTSVNEYLKFLNTILKFSYERELLPKEFKVKLIKKTTDSRSERATLPKETIKRLISTAKTPALSEAYKLLYLTGMRLSEVYKCEITTIGGVECFDLRSADSLKTKSSYRLIPVHKDLNAGKALEAIRTLNPNYVSKQATKALTGDKESLYSLRHSFATDLLQNNIYGDTISELMGHSHQTMTLSRYAKGYSIDILETAINTLTL